MDLSIVIVTHNSLSLVEECLRSIEQYPPSFSFETIIIDNASTDGTPEMIAGKFENVRLVANDENTGYSRGVNQGIKLGSGRMILILNPDIVLRDGSIDNLIAFMDKTPQAGIAASKLLYPDGRIQYSCRRFYTLQALIFRRTFLGKLLPRAKPLREHLMMDYDHEEVREVDWVTGACMLARREAIEKVGLMDERFFLYFEDIDWCYRMKNQGWSVFYVPQSVMIHRFERASAKSMFRKPFVIHLLSMLRYAEKWNKIFYFLRLHRGALMSVAFVITDLIAMNLAFFAAYAARDLLQPLFINRLYPIDWYRFFILFYNLIYLITFLFSGLYRIRRETPKSEEFFRVTRAILLGVAILLASTYLARVRIYSRAVVLGQAVFTILAVFGFRQILRGLHRELVRANFDLKRVLLIGSESEVRTLTGQLANVPELGIEVVGCINEGPESLGSMGDIGKVVAKFKVQEVVVLPSYQGDKSLLPFIVYSRDRMIQIRVVSPLASILGSNVRVEELAGVHMFSIERGVASIVLNGLKRVIDIISALLLLPFVSLLSLGYLLYSRVTGRIQFFGEIRRGAGGRRIVWPRAITSTGSEAGDVFKARIFMYLLTGHLSLIGPPPLPPSRFESESGGIYNVRPGITGKWRILSTDGWREAVEREMLDLQNWSFGRDMLILIQSVGAIASGAYPPWFYEEGSET